MRQIGMSPRDRSKTNIIVFDESNSGTSFRSQLGGNVISHKLAPFRGNRRELKSRGITLSFPNSHEEFVRGTTKDTDLGIYFFVPNWRNHVKKDRGFDESEFVNSVAELRERLRNSGGKDSKLVLFDTVDSTASPFFGALPYVDLFVKSQTLRNLDDYQRRFDGGWIFSDWIQNNQGFDLNGWHLGAIPDNSQVYKIFCGWNFGASPFFQKLNRFAKFVPPIRKWLQRPIDLNTRFPVKEKEGATRWELYQEYRAFAGQAVREISLQITRTGFEKVPKIKYLLEAHSSRAIFSPFGWGEICFRDYEATALGALLIKPDTSHLATNPDIFVGGDSYVPVNWDLSDLDEKCQQYLDPSNDKSLRIVQEAQRRLEEYHRTGFVAQIEDIVARVQS